MNLLEYRDGKLFKELFETIEPQLQHTVGILGRKIRIMEVCGTHTVSFSKTGVREVLRPYVELISGPGCPVCVTDQSDIDQMIAYAALVDVIVTTFGDMMKVPGTKSTLYQERAAGADVRVVYSPSQAVDIAKRNPEKRVVFLGVGFETTAPSIAVSIKKAKAEGIDNYFVHSAHKLTPPAVEVLIGDPDHKIDGFFLPGHVSVIVGRIGWRNLEKANVPAVIGGFDAVDLLTSVFLLTKELQKPKRMVANNYERSVKDQGNQKAQQMLEDVFAIRSTMWRGFGEIPASGLGISAAYSEFDANAKLHVEKPKTRTTKGCRCGEIVKGKESPFDCKLFNKACRPDNPIGPCMVSSEGTCSTYYQFERDKESTVTARRM
ncbi:hydrogenase formation protein HypD [Pseudalkalibacillus sp. R45]|uniref:hydrogenase formation protein HypD n=1 Tax=Pseudalkalibacillus sp. R45 TaxID=3457433 RepID=UPI003FCD3CBF